MACAVSADERRLFLDAIQGQLAALPVDLVWLDGAPIGRLREFNPEIVLTGWSTAPLPQDWVDSDGCALRYVCHLTGSVRSLVPRAFIERGGMVSNWGGVPSTAVAEHALLLALAALRNLPAWPQAAQLLHDTTARIEGLHPRSLFGRRVGIHGFGRVAQALVLLLRPFGVSIGAYSAGVPAEIMRAAEVTPCASLEQLFARNEIIFECEGLTPATAGSVSASVIAALPAGSVFVNVARGQLVDEAALLLAAASGRVRVALDVIATRPWQETMEAFRAAGAVLSPHIGGPTLDQYRRCGEHAVRNIGRYLERQPLEALVTIAAYDRST